MVLPVNLKPSFFSPLLMASDSLEVAGTCSMVSHLLTLGCPPTKDQRRYEKDPVVFSYSRNAFALLTAALILRHSLSDENEAFSAALQDSSFTSWGTLRNTIANKLEFTMEWPDGQSEQLPVGRQFDLMSSTDNGVRDAAAAGINNAWERLPVS